MTDPKTSGLSTSEGKMHALLVLVGSLLTLLMPILTALHASSPSNPWIGFAFTCVGALLALFSAKNWLTARTELKQTMLDPAPAEYDPTKSAP